MGDHGIDPFSEYSLRDVLENDFHPQDDNFTFEYYGFHIVPQGGGRYGVNYDGHAGLVLDFHRNDYDDVLELVADLNELLLESYHYDYQGDKEGLVEWAGKIMTDDEEKAEAEPHLYLKVPDRPPEDI